MHSIDRRTFVGAATSAAVLTASGAGTALAEEAMRGTWATGTYTGTGTGYMGTEITGTVVLDDSGIAAIKFADDCAQTYGIGTHALRMMPERIIAAQSIGVDTVAGCTMSSKGVLGVVADALAQAGGDLEAWSQCEVADLSLADPIEFSADTVILGGGGAGMATALRVMDFGKTVLLIEKNDILGGNTARSEGHVFIGGSEYQKSLGIEDDAQSMRNDYGYNCHFLYREDMFDILMDQAGPTFDWLLEDSGMTPSDVLISETYAGQSGILRVYEPASKRASEFTASMDEAVNANPLATVLYGIAAKSLVTENNVVVGAEGVDIRTGQKYVFKGGNVVIATGCFPGNDPELREQYGVKELYRSSGNPACCGEGQLMALELGAGTYRLGQETVRVSNAFEYAPGRGCAMGAISNVLAAGNGIVVDNSGHRLAAEYDGIGSPALSYNMVHALPEGSVYAVLDEATFTENFYKPTSDLTDETNCFDAWLEQNNCEAGGIAHGATVEEAAERAGIDPEMLAATVRYYNYNLTVDGVDEMHRVDGLPLDTESGEIYIMKLSQSYVCSSGGLWVDETMAVCNEEHAPIAGLYAAGNVAGGGMGEPYYHGGSVAWSLVTGKISGER